MCQQVGGWICEWDATVGGSSGGGNGGGGSSDSAGTNRIGSMPLVVIWLMDIVTAAAVVVIVFEVFLEAVSLETWEIMEPVTTLIVAER